MNRDGIVWVVLVFLAVAMTVPVATACDEDCDGCVAEGLPLGYRQKIVAIPCSLSITGGLNSLIAGKTIVGCKATCNRCTNPSPVVGGTCRQCDNTYPETVIFSFCSDTPSGFPSAPIIKGTDKYYLEGGGGKVDVCCEPAACSGTEATRNNTPVTAYSVFKITSKKTVLYEPIGDDPNDPQPNWVQAACLREQTKSVSQNMALISKAESKGICTSEQLATCLSGVSCNNVTVSQ